MGRQRVHGRPLFVNRKSEKVKDGIVTTSRRQLTTKSRLDIFDCTGVPAQEYDITLPCGIRREALPIRHNIGRHSGRFSTEEIRILWMSIAHSKGLEEIFRFCYLKFDHSTDITAFPQIIRIFGFFDQKHRLNSTKSVVSCVHKYHQGSILKR